jgi:hypothetical protein
MPANGVMPVKLFNFESLETLSLGGSIRWDGDPETVIFLKSSYRGTQGLLTTSDTDLERREVLIQAIGNSRSNVFNEEVRSELNSSDPSMRANAMDALRFPQDSESRALLQQSIAKESDLRARAIGYQALGYQPYDETTKNLLRQCVTSESWSNVRLECYRILVTRINDPETVSLLESRASSDQDEQLREVARQAVETARAKK